MSIDVSPVKYSDSVSDSDSYFGDSHRVNWTLR